MNDEFYLKLGISTNIAILLIFIGSSGTSEILDLTDILISTNTIFLFSYLLFKKQGDEQ